MSIKHENSPSYSGFDSFIEEAKKYIGSAQGGRTISKQMEGKNRPMIKKQDENAIYNGNKDRLHLDEKGDTVLFYLNIGTKEEPRYRYPTKFKGAYEKK